jgi:hypothetical protein
MTSASLQGADLPKGQNSQPREYRFGGMGDDDFGFVSLQGRHAKTTGYVISETNVLRARYVSRSIQTVIDRLKSSFSELSPVWRTPATLSIVCADWQYPYLLKEGIAEMVTVSKVERPLHSR